MRLKGSRILVVDDDQEWLEMLMEALRDEGHVVRAAASGTQALSILESFTPDVIVTDLQMPLMDGEQLVAKMQAHRADLPVIVVTGTVGKIGAPELASAFGVIQKPVDLDKLLAAVAAAVASSATSVRHVP